MPDGYPAPLKTLRTPKNPSGTLKKPQNHQNPLKIPKISLDPSEYIKTTHCVPQHVPIWANFVAYGPILKIAQA